MRSLAAFLTDVAVAVGYLTVAAIIGPPAPKDRDFAAWEREMAGEQR